jgi:hypothetical protein
LGDIPNGAAKGGSGSATWFDDDSRICDYPDLRGDAREFIEE